MSTGVLDERLVAGLLDDIYDAAIDSARWPALLQRLTRASGAAGAMFAALSFKRPEGSFLDTHGLDPALEAAFLQRHQVNPWSLAAARAPCGQPVHPRRLAALPGLRRTDFYGEILEPQGLVSCAFVNLQLGADFATGGVSLLLRAGSDGVHDRCVQLLGALAPHLQRATVAKLRLQEAAPPDGLAEAFDCVASAVLLVDAQARIVFANARARRMLAAADGLCSLRDGVAAARLAQTRQLRRLIALAGASVAGAGGSLALPRGGQRAPLVAMVIPLRRAGDRLASLLPRPTAVLLVTDPDEALTSEAAVAARLRALYDMTPAESRVAVRVAQGLGLQETAARLDIGAGTAHAHLKRVFAKTGVRRQSSLARLLTRTGVLDIDPD